MKKRQVEAREDAGIAVQHSQWSLSMYRVESWTYPTDEEGGDHEIDFAALFDEKHLQDAKDWAWDRMEEGFAIRMFRE